MPVYIGSLGRMIKLPYVGSQQVQSEERYNFSSTLEGKRKAQVKPRGPRTWALSADHFRPNEHSLLSQFADGAWGPGPFVFVSADAPNTNLLTPDDTLLRTAEANHASAGAPPFLTPDGWAAKSYLNEGNFVRLAERVPILPGARITGSAYARGAGGRVRLQFVNESDSPLTQHNSAAMTDITKRHSVTATAPAEAAYVQLWVTPSVVQVAWPAVTWTDTVQPYGDGQGCSKAVVHGVSRDQVLAVPGHTFSNLSFTVTEVG